MNSIFKKISSDAFLYSVMPQLPRLINLFLLPVTTPFLNTTDFAIFGTVMAYAMAFEIIKSLGLDIVLMNSFFKTPESYKTIWAKVEGIISAWSLVLSVIIGFVIYKTLPSELSEADKWFVTITTSLPSALFAGLSKIATLYYQYKQKPFPLVIRSFVMGVLAVIINYYTIVELHLGFKGWFYSGLVTGILLPLSYVHPMWIKERIYPVYYIKWSEFKEMMAISLPVVPHHYANYFLNYSDRVILNIFHIPDFQVGLYNLGYTVSNNFRYFTNAIDKVLGPTYHKILSSKQNLHLIQYVTFVFGAGYLLMGFLGGVWMKECFSILIRNAELQQAYSIAIIILFSFTTRPLYNGAQSFLFFEERTRKLWQVTFAFGILNVLLNVLLVPYFGIVAAAINTFICIAGSNYGIFFLRDYRSIAKVNFYPLQWILATVLILGVSWSLKDASFAVKALVTLAAGTGCLMFIFVMRKRISS